VTHACNPSYSGGRDQEDHSSKPAQAKIGLVEWLKVKALSSNPSTAKKKANKSPNFGETNSKVSHLDTNIL
jgi:hypothetical protein